VHSRYLQQTLTINTLRRFAERTVVTIRTNNSSDGKRWISPLFAYRKAFV